MNKLISTAQIKNRQELIDLFKEADRYRTLFDQNSELINQPQYKLIGTDHLSGLIVATVFHERSTRTRLSFETAAHRLGAKVITETEITSSAGKSESFSDTIHNIALYADIVVFRHPEANSVVNAQNAMKSFENKVLINAGNGNHEHPTQALTDIYTIWRKYKKLHFSVMFCGDLVDSRPVHSWINLVKNTIIEPTVFLAATPGMELSRQWAEKLGSCPIVAIKDIPEFIKNVDVLYMTRTQTERKTESNRPSSHFMLYPNHIESMSPDSIVLHPLPRNSEIHRDCDNSSRSLYKTEQIKNGLYLRMALMTKMINNTTNFDQTS